MRLSKHHGLGNDFLVALVDEVPATGADLARTWCHRTLGVGADGLVFGTPSEAADLSMTLFNSDGSEAEISGNGIRCLAQAELARHHANHLTVETLAGVRELELISTDGNQAQIAVDMGVVNELELLVGLDDLARPGFEVRRAAMKDVGNPHIVVEVDDLAAVEVGMDGPALEALWKPGGMNIHFLVPLADGIELLHWERGAGATAACGSGATASATVAHEWGLVGTDVTVSMPGGVAKVLVGASATLIGPAVHVADVEVLDG